MPRTTSDLVKGIINVKAGVDLTPFILSANELVTECCEPVTRLDGSPWHSDVRLELIERWLSAHFYAVFKPRSVSVTAGTVQESTESKVDIGLRVTKYGQQALDMDTSGALAALDNSLKKVTKALPGGGRSGVTWLGTERV
jgi:hypothetical protein